MLLLERPIAEGAPISGVGIQEHWHLDTNLPGIEKAISSYESPGLKVSISELDVTATGSNTGAFPIRRGRGAPVSAEALEKQADVYAKERRSYGVDRRVSATKRAGGRAAQTVWRNGA